MPHREEMLGGVLVLGGITATYVLADQALAQVHPRISHLQALLATVRAGRHVPYLVQVRASLHAQSPFLHSSRLAPRSFLLRILTPSEFVNRLAT